MTRKSRQILFWVVSWTWGILMTFMGAVGALACLCLGHKPKRYGNSIYFELGDNWGGVCMGTFFFVSSGASTSVKDHEMGHSFQNLILGPLFVLAVAIPSAVRCAYFNWVAKHNPEKYAKMDYYRIWFEGGASKVGEDYHKRTKKTLKYE